MLLGPHLDIRLPSRASTEDLVVVIETPDRQMHQPEYVSLRDQKISMKYTPYQVGTHLIDIFYQGSRIKGSPFQFYVNSDGLRQQDGIDMGLRVSQHRETAATTANTTSMLSHWSGGAEHGFGYRTVNGGGELLFSRQVSPVGEVGVCYQLRLRSANGGDLDKSMLVAFDGPEKVDVDLEECSRREYQLSYTFFAPGEYLMRVLVGGADLLTPIPVRVVGDAVGLSSRGSFFAATSTTTAAAAAAAAAAAPAGGGGNSGAWFSSARHLNLGEGAFHSGSSELRHSDVCVYGEGVERGWTGRESSFEVQLPWHATKESGPLTVTVDGPSKVDLLYNEVAHNVFQFRYTPTSRGEYFVAIKLGPDMRHVLASPYRVIVH